MKKKTNSAAPSAELQKQTIDKDEKENAGDTSKVGSHVTFPRPRTDFAKCYRRDALPRKSLLSWMPTLASGWRRHVRSSRENSNRVWDSLLNERIGEWCFWQKQLGCKMLSMLQCLLYDTSKLSVKLDAPMIQGDWPTTWETYETLDSLEPDPSYSPSPRMLEGGQTRYSTSPTLTMHPTFLCPKMLHS